MDALQCTAFSGRISASMLWCCRRTFSDQLFKAGSSSSSNAALTTQSCAAITHSRV